MTTKSLLFRRSAYADQTEIVPIALLTITHALLADPVRLSTDPTERFSVDPLSYGTTSNGNRFLFILMSANIPDDRREEPPKTQLVLDNVDADMVTVLRSFTTYADVDMQIVLSSTPNVVESNYAGMQIVKASGDANQITLDIAREPFTHEPWPSARMTRERFPGLWK